MADGDTNNNNDTALAPLLLIIRFTTSVPDLPLPIISPHTTTGLAVKQLIRAHLPADTRARRLRLIHAGRVLPDTLPLTKTLKLVLPPPSSSFSPPENSPSVGASTSSSSSSLALSPSPAHLHSHQTSPSPSVSRAQNVLFGRSTPTSTVDGNNGNTTKGKEIARDEEGVSLLQPSGQVPPRTPVKKPHAQIRIYIHCSVGQESLTPVELAEEAAAAEASTKKDTDEGEAHARSKGKGVATGVYAAETETAAPASTTTAPRGFDRLLGAGFSPAEVAALRSQFVALQSHTHTPDTMPSAAEMRMLEDRWMDESVAGGSGGGNAPDTDDVQRGALEDMLLGNIMGFFWPIGAVVWLLREEGVWSRRRQIAVFTGMLANITFSILRVTS